MDGNPGYVIETDSSEMLYLRRQGVQIPSNIAEMARWLGRSVHLSVCNPSVFN